MHQHAPWVLLLVLTGCGPAETPERVPARDGPAATFAVLEDRLLGAETVRMTFEVTAEGAVEAAIQGEFQVAPDGEIELTGVGEFAGRHVDLLLRSGGDRYEFGDSDNPATAARPSWLNEALLVGLTRMGILHNVARLSGGAPPDHADGGVRDWVTVDGFVSDAAESSVVTFDLTVSGERAGSASLEIDARGHPVERRQTVQFPSGEMRVMERYRAVTIEP